MTTRKANWWMLLMREFRMYDGVPWRWGESDCYCFAADCVRAMTGRDIAADVRGTYRTEAAANDVIARLGYGNLAGMLAERMAANGWRPHAHVASASVGDVGVTRSGIACVKMPGEWLARDGAGKYRIVRPVKAWGVV